MNEIDGMTLARNLRQNHVNSLIVFTTSSRDHAIESYDVQALHYLVKPITQEKLDAVMSLSEKSPADHQLLYRSQGRADHGPRPGRDIMYTDYYNHYIQIHTQNPGRLRHTCRLRISRRSY